MDGDEREISKEQLQSWIRDEVHKARLTSPGILRNYTQLQSLLQRRQTQATRLVELCQSVMVFEDTVKELYSLLGWEYTDFDSDSDDGDEPMSCRRTLPFLFVSSGDHIRRPSTSRVSTAHSPTSEDERSICQKRPAAFLNKEAVVVLSKLTPSQVASAMAPPSPDGNSTKDAISSSPESDMQWEPDEEMSDSSEASVSDFSTGSNKKRKINKNERKYAKLTPASKRRRNTAAKTRKAKATLSDGKKSTDSACVAAETSSSPATSPADAESGKQDAAALRSHSKKTSKGEQERGTKKTSLTTAAKTGVKTSSRGKTTETTAQSSNASTTSKPTITQSTAPPSKTVSAESNAKQTPASQPSSNTTNAPPPPPPSVPKEEIKLNMFVLARKRSLCWQRGKVAEIITKENGKVKYKITFEGKGKVLVSGHHLAFDRMPKVEELSIGSRVVVKSPSDATEYQPAIMAELPSRKNRMRFLVYTDDHTPMYVGLPSFHVVYRPLENPLDDIPDENHREFMKEYLRVWPYPPQTQYKVGQSLKAEYEGIMQKCEVVTVDSSLIEVIFEIDQHKEWLYRGSLRLEHMVNMKYCIWKNKDDKSTKKPCSFKSTH